MRKTTSLLLLLLTMSATAQTYVQYATTNFVGGITATNTYGTNSYFIGNFTGDLTIDVPANTLATVINAQGTADIHYADPRVQHAGYPQLESGETTQDGWDRIILLNTPILGPATITYRVDSWSSFHNPTPNLCFMALVKFEAVNTTPAIAGFAVQPANNTATIILETSTNLTTWVPASNGTYGRTNAARFFRMNLSTSP